MIIPILYTNEKSIYAGIAEPWPKTRDARQWDGPGPAIAHPPCGPWGRLKGLCKSQDKDCGLIAVSQIRKHRGIVEQPADSSLWLATCSRTGDLWGGNIYRVYQSDFGHAALKPTDLYAVGLGPPPPLPPARRVGLRPLEHLSRIQRSATPAEFATWLIKWVRDG